MMADSPYRRAKHRNGEWAFSNSSVYEDRSRTLGEMLATGFFRKEAQLERNALVLLFGSDGWVMVQCTGHDVEGTAILEQAQLVSIPLKLTRKAA